MSHGDASHNASLIPLLDLVFQLIMFFMLCANFVMEQVNESIRLPDATAAKSLDRTQTSLLYLNVNPQGHVLRVDGNALTNPPQIQQYLRDRYRQAQQALGNDKKSDGKVPTTVIIRADKACVFKQVFEVMKACKSAGFEKIQLRAIVQSDTSAKGK